MNSFSFIILFLIDARLDHFTIIRNVTTIPIKANDKLCESMCTITCHTTPGKEKSYFLILIILTNINVQPRQNHKTQMQIQFTFQIVMLHIAMKVSATVYMVTMITVNRQRRIRKKYGLGLRKLSMIRVNRQVGSIANFFAN